MKSFAILLYCNNVIHVVKTVQNEKGRAEHRKQEKVNLPDTFDFQYKNEEKHNLPNARENIPKNEPKIETKFEPKIEPKIESKIEPKIDPKIEPKIEPKFEPKNETHIEVTENSKEA